MAPRTSLQPDITLGELFVFLSVADESKENQMKAMGRAAANFLANPARITGAVDRLDDRFGCALIEKGAGGRRNGKLTSEGERVAAFAAVAKIWYDFLMDGAVEPEARLEILRDQVEVLKQWRNSRWGADEPQDGAGG